MRSRILIVDDDTIALGLTQELLSDRGYDVDMAVSVHEASERLSKTGYRVVVTDLKMPDRPGTDLVEICVWRKGGTQATVSV